MIYKYMPKLTTYTSTLPTELMEWVNNEAGSKKMPKNALIEHALREYRDKTKANKMKDGFLRAAADTEMTELVESGLEDFTEQLTRLER